LAGAVSRVASGRYRDASVRRRWRGPLLPADPAVVRVASLAACAMGALARVWQRPRETGDHIAADGSPRDAARAFRSDGQTRALCPAAADPADTAGNARRADAEKGCSECVVLVQLD